MGRKEPTYDECYSFVLLKECLHMQNLELSDKPDILYENQFGIEVVSAIFEEEKRLEEILVRRKECKKADPLPKGYKETRYGIEHPMMVSQDPWELYKCDRHTSTAIELIKREIDKKKKKVETYQYPTDRLFVWTIFGIDDDELKTIGSELYQYAKGTFHTLYVLVVDANCLMVCDANGVSLHYHQEKQYEYSLLAREICKRECEHE